MHRLCLLLLLATAGACGGGGAVVIVNGNVAILDLAQLGTVADLLRLHGSEGTGARGLPVSGGADCDGDGDLDFAMASFQASPQGRFLAGEIYLVFGDGTISGTLDTAVDQARILRIQGDETRETAGNEIWMDDLTGDGVGDLIIGRQNFGLGGTRVGCGALTIIVGGPELQAHANTLTPLDLRAPPASITVLTLVGGASLDRLGIWMRTGDVDGDTIADLVVGADQESGAGTSDRGVVFVIRGGAHLATNQAIDLAGFGATALAGQIARIVPPPGSNDFHLGATCQVADLDGNDRAEVLAAAALERAGAGIDADGAPPGSADAVGGAPDGTLFIAWDDNFPAGAWPAGYTVDLGAAPGTVTSINGGPLNDRFGEEILGGLDYDGDQRTDLFVGDITGDPPFRNNAGTAHVLFDIVSLRGLAVDLHAPPPGLAMTTFLGEAAGDIAGDTAMHGDFDFDGIDDFGFSAPHHAALGRFNSGGIYVFYGRAGAWPAEIDLTAPPPPNVTLVEVYGANAGDVLAYSAAFADMDGDNRIDIITNEMTGDGLAPGTDGVGNLIIISGARLSNP